MSARLAVVARRARFFCHDGSSILPSLDVDVVAEGSLQFAIEGIAVAGGRELAEHAADVLAQVEVLLLLHHVALHGEVEAAEVVEHHRMALAQVVLHLLHEGDDDAMHVRLRHRIVMTDDACQVLCCHFACLHGTSVPLSLQVFALVLIEFNLDCHVFNHLRCMLS